MISGSSFSVFHLHARQVRREDREQAVGDGFDRGNIDHDAFGPHLGAQVQHRDGQGDLLLALQVKRNQLPHHIVHEGAREVRSVGVLLEVTMQKNAHIRDNEHIGEPSSL